MNNELKTKLLNLSLIRERNAAIDPHLNASIYACDVVALIDDVLALSRPQPADAPPVSEVLQELRKQQLQVEIDDGVLRISIGVDLLCHAVQVPWKESGFNYRVIDKDAFAKAIANELEREDEEGSTPLHFVFDKAADEAIEQGADGVEEFQDDEEQDDDE
jgi:hypothetical protein